VSCGALKPDAPVSGSTQLVLSQWTLQCANKTVFDKTLLPTVPGDLVNDLIVGGVVPDALTDSNFVKDAYVWWENEWTYTTVFDVATQQVPSSWVLVLDGIKMGAHVVLNNVTIGVANNQFM
jgi:hypothetical protein